MRFEEPRAFASGGGTSFVGYHLPNALTAYAKTARGHPQYQSRPLFGRRPDYPHLCSLLPGDDYVAN